MPTPCPLNEIRGTLKRQELIFTLYRTNIFCKRSSSTSGPSAKPSCHGRSIYRQICSIIGEWKSADVASTIRPFSFSGAERLGG